MKRKKDGLSVELGELIEDPEEALFWKSMIGFQEVIDEQEYNPGIEQAVLGILDIEKENTYFDFPSADEATIYFRRGNQIFVLDIYERSDVSEAIEKVRDGLLEKGLPLLLEDDVANKDAILIDDSGDYCGVRIREEEDRPGYVAEGIERLVVDIFGSGGEPYGVGVVVKVNGNEEITHREEKILKGIDGYKELEDLGVRAPEVYESRGNKLCMENISYPTVEDYLGREDVSSEERQALAERIVKATQIIENNMPKYFSNEDDVEGGESLLNLGKEHESAVQYLRERGMFDKWLSDSRFGNWLYDKEEDVLYKIDENIAQRGSEFSCLARIADFDESLSIEEREELLEGLKPDNLEEAYLSLYASNMESALGLQEQREQDLFNKRLVRAEDYLDRLVGISNKWKKLRREFKATFLNKYANTRAA